MTHPHFTILYVDSPKASAAFYAGLLDCEPVEQSPTFCLFALQSGLMLGLLSRHTTEPAPGVAGGGTELGFQVEDAAAVDTLYAEWSGRDLRVLQKPVDLDFGRTFVVLDPDCHRLRVFAPTAA
jgi:predicted enzyme related to lactoylglutathione lyase